MPRISVVNTEGRKIEVEAVPNRSIMENIRDIDAGVAAICGGLCSCSTCHVYVDPEWRSRLPQRRPEETAMLRDLTGFDAAGSRLSCQIIFRDELDGIAVTVAPDE